MRYINCVIQFLHYRVLHDIMGSIALELSVSTNSMVR